MKELIILGSTGSIGTQALDVVRANSDIRVTGLAAAKNYELLEKQAREFEPLEVCLFDEIAAAKLRGALSDTNIRVYSGQEGVMHMAAECRGHMVLCAMVGMDGIRPAIAAAQAGRDIALANKETLVSAGHIIMPLVRECGIRLLPVDSEHSAIFQCLEGEGDNAITRIILTASGGPFRGMGRQRLENVTVEDALRHPSWSMGKKVTVDSATLANKGLEAIEAAWLFGMPVDKIEPVIHPQSVIHSMVEFEDGAIKAQLGVPDMRLPIQYALCYPKRRPLSCGRLDFASLASITFEKPDTAAFPALSLAYDAARTGGSMPTAFNAANEWAVGKFLNGTLLFPEIADSISYAMQMHGASLIKSPTVDNIFDIRAAVCEILESRYF